MKLYILFFIFVASSLHAQVLFRPANAFEKENIQSSMIDFYIEESLQAGIYENENMAKEAAMAEITQEKPDTEFFHYCLISEDDGMVCGYLVYSLSDQTAYLEAIYLEEKYRGKGLGKQTFHVLESLLLENGIHVIKLYVFDHNKRAIGLYNTTGFEIETTYSTDDRPIGHIMKKNLPCRI